MAVIRSFRELKTYERARAEAWQIFELSRKFPKEECYSITDQIRGSSRAVGAMVGEAWARRRYEAVFINKISEALGEATETQVWLGHALACGYMTEIDHRKIAANWAEIGAMLQGMIDKAPPRCSEGADT